MKVFNKLIALVFLLTSVSSCSKNIKSSSYFADHVKNEQTSKKIAITKNNLQISVHKSIKISDYKIINHVISDNLLFCINEKGFLIAFDISSEKLLWSKNIIKLKNTIALAGIAKNKDKLLLTYNDRLYQFNLNGDLLNYVHLLDVSLSNPILHNDIIYVFTNNNLLILQQDLHLINKINLKMDSINLLSGHAAHIYGLNANTILHIGSNGSLELADIYFGQNIPIYIPKINFLNNKKYNSTYFNVSGLNCLPVTIGDKVFVYHNIEGLFMINKNGQLMQRKTIKDITQMTVTQDALYLLNNANQISALSLNDLSTIWVKDLSNLSDSFQTTKITGEIQDQKEIKNKILDFEYFSNIVTYQDSLIFASGGKKFYIINKNGDNFENDTENRTFHFKITDSKESGVNTLFIRNNNLFAINNREILIFKLKNK